MCGVRAIRASRRGGRRFCAPARATPCSRVRRGRLAPRLARPAPPRGLGERETFQEPDQRLLLFAEIV